MAESKGWAKALRRVTRGGPDSTSSPGRAPSNMRDWVATMEVHCTRAEEGRKLKVECKSGRKNIRQRRDAEVGGECAGKFAVRERENDSRSEKERNKARKQESKKARKQESKKARKQESKKARKQESKKRRRDSQDWLSHGSLR